MNKQKRKRGVGIGWTDATWNPVGGCKHDCWWDMPNGERTQCYAKTVAEGVARAAYPDGFEAHYWRPHMLNEPLQHRRPMKIFIDSMSDLFGGWVDPKQIDAVLDVVRRANWHTFQVLTKNPRRLVGWAGDLPPNLWVGVSLPPSGMGKASFSLNTQVAKLREALDVLEDMRVPVRWMSFEPLSWDVAPYLAARASRKVLQWGVIGAASAGHVLYQPRPEWVSELVDELHYQGAAVYYKENLTTTPRLTEFPNCATMPANGGL